MIAADKDAFDPAGSSALDPAARGALDPTARGALDPAARGALDPAERGALDPALRQNAAASFASLFTSGSTLICCALPALLVSIGAGAALAGLVTTFPQIIWLSEHKAAMFAVAGVMLIAAGVMQWRARSLPCPADAALAAACTRARKWSLAIYAFSVLMFVTGFFFAFIAPTIFA